VPQIAIVGDATMIDRVALAQDLAQVSHDDPQHLEEPTRPRLTRILLEVAQLYQVRREKGRLSRLVAELHWILRDRSGVIRRAA